MHHDVAAPTRTRRTRHAAPGVAILLGVSAVVAVACGGKVRDLGSEPSDPGSSGGAGGATGYGAGNLGGAPGSGGDTNGAAGTGDDAPGSDGGEAIRDAAYLILEADGAVPPGVERTFTFDADACHRGGVPYDCEASTASDAVHDELLGCGGNAGCVGYYVEFDDYGCAKWAAVNGGDDDEAVWSCIANTLKTRVTCAANKAATRVVTCAP